MAVKYKGIVVEIGGETKSLDKAMDGAASRSKSLQNELKQVDKLLKLDPKNTDLLAQRQQILSQSVEQTRTKLTALTAAQEQMARANAANAGWESAYAPLGKAIDETQNKLKALQKQELAMKQQLENGEISDKEYEQFRKTLDEMQTQARSLQKQKKDLDAQFSDGHISDEEYRKFQRELVKTEAELKNLESQSKTAKAEVSKLGDIAGELGAKFSAAGDKIGKAANDIAPLSLAAGAAAGSLVKMAFDAGKSADDINTLAKQTGLSTSQIQKFMYATDLIDVPLETLTGSMAKLTRNMQTASKGTGDAYKAFSELGVSVTGVDGRLRNNQDVFNQTINALGRMENGTQRDAYAMQIFGKSAQDLNPLILGGADALKQLGDEAEAAGLILSQDALDSANAFNDEVDVMKAKLQAMAKIVGGEIGQILMPILQTLVQLIIGGANAFNSLSTETKSWILAILTLIAGLAPFLMIISSVFKTVSNITLGIKGLSDVASAFSGAGGNSVYQTFLKWSVIIMGIIAGLALLVALINVLIGKGPEMDRTVSGMGGFMTGSNQQSPKIHQWASGTNYHPGGLALVGEQGAELLELPRGARVYNNRQTRSILENSPAQGGDTFQINVNVQSLSDIQQLIKMSEEARRMQRMGKVKS